jgi:hypothetical protein
MRDVLGLASIRLMSETSRRKLTEDDRPRTRRHLGRAGPWAHRWMGTGSATTGDNLRHRGLAFPELHTRHAGDCNTEAQGSETTRDPGGSGREGPGTEKGEI